MVPVPGHETPTSEPLIWLRREADGKTTIATFPTALTENIKQDEKMGDPNESLRGLKPMSEMPPLSSLGLSESTIHVFSRLVRARRSAAAALDSRFPIAEALHSQSKLSSPTQSDQHELQRIESTVKAILGILTKYRRIIITSNGYIGTAHPQVRKGDKIFSLQGSSIPYVVLRAANLPPDQLSKINEDIEKIRSGNKGTASNGEGRATSFHVIGEASLAGIQRLQSTPPEWKIECVGLI